MLEKRLTGSRNVLRKIILTTSLFAFSLIPRESFSQSNTDNQYEKWDLIVELNGGYIQNFHHLNLLNIPENVRNVPIHKDDTYVSQSNAGPIPNDNATLFKSGLERNIRVGIRKLKPDSYFLLGVESFNVFKMDQFKSSHERNYTNAIGTEKKGYGAALTYYDISTNEGNGLTYYIGAFMRYSFYIGKGYLVREKETEVSEKNSNFLPFIFLEYSVQYCNLSASTGWDRYSTLEQYKSYNLGTAIENNLKVGFEGFLNFTRIFFDLKYSRYSISPSKDGEGIELDSKDQFSFELGVGVSGVIK